MVHHWGAGLQAMTLQTVSCREVPTPHSRIFSTIIPLLSTQTVVLSLTYSISPCSCYLSPSSVIPQSLIICLPEGGKKQQTVSLLGHKGGFEWWQQLCNFSKIFCPQQQMNLPADKSWHCVSNLSPRLMARHAHQQELNKSVPHFNTLILYGI